jgi:uncharacterized protein (DUF924 family)
MTPDDILHFWFEEIDHGLWWKKDESFDQLAIDRFSYIHNKAIQGELFEWRLTPKGSLAEIIILDQFSRNMFRDTARAFAYDGMALVLSQEAISAEFDRELNPIENSFLFMPFMHSESALIHVLALALYKRNGIQNNLDFEIKHKEIIDRFGRYPHRNTILGRESTADEIAFLKEPGSSF